MSVRDEIKLYVDEICPAATTAQLAEEIDATNRAIREQCNVLADVGLLERMKHPDDGRKTLWVSNAPSTIDGLDQPTLTIIFNQGYEKIYHRHNGKNSLVPVHRLIQYAENGCVDEVVHHKNRMRADNRPENLEDMTSSEHMKQHWSLNNQDDAKDLST